MSSNCALCGEPFEVGDDAVEISLVVFEPGPKSGRPVASPSPYSNGIDKSFVHVGECSATVDELMMELGVLEPGVVDSPFDGPEPEEEEEEDRLESTG